MNSLVAQQVKDLVLSPREAQVTAMAQVQSLARKLPHATGVAGKKKKCVCVYIYIYKLCIITYIYIYIFFGCIDGIQKFPCHGTNLYHGSDNARSLTH